MIIVGPLIEVAIVLLDIYKWVVILAVIMSLLFSFNVVNASNRFVHVISGFLFQATEPALRPIRRFLPNLGGLDISPILLLVALFFLQRVLQEILWSLSGAGF